MLHTDPTLRALLAACVREPDDDTPRLALADALDEQGGEVECGKCGGKGKWYREGVNILVNYWQDCPTCSGRGRVPDSLAAWATYIRAAVELERVRQQISIELPKPQNALAWEMARLHNQCIALLAAHGREWVRGERCERCDYGLVTTDDEKYMREFDDAGKLRPFLVSVECPICHGTGYTGPLSRVPFEAIGWSRGLPCSVRAPLSEWGREGPCQRCFGNGLRPRPFRSDRKGSPVCPACNGEYDRRTWLPSSWALAVCEQWPVVRCGVADRQAFDWTDHGNSNEQYAEMWHEHPWGWCKDNAGPAACNLPAEVFEATKRYGKGPFGRGSGNGHDTPAAAHDALARAIYSLARAAIERERKQGAAV